ncbi:MAG: YHS domain-containing (seleno)protein [Planctomycetota bacterium]
MKYLLLLALPLLGCATPAPLCTATVQAMQAPTPSRAYLHSHNLGADGVAIDGHSPVSYFDGKVERGAPGFAVEHDGVTYWLTGADQVARFRREPGRYVPAFGGWCAFGMSVEDKFPIDPHNYRIVRGRLLLFLRNPGIDASELWGQGDEQQLLDRAEAHWQKVHG